GIATMPANGPEDTQNQRERRRRAERAVIRLASDELLAEKVHHWPVEVAMRVVQRRANTLKLVGITDRRSIGSIRRQPASQQQGVLASPTRNRWPRCCHTVDGRWHLEPQHLVRDAKDLCPPHQLRELFGGRAFLNAAELRLSQFEPIGDKLLRQWSAVVRMCPISEDHAAHVPGREGIADLVGMPELTGNARRLLPLTARGGFTRGAERFGVVAIQPGTASGAVTLLLGCPFHGLFPLGSLGRWYAVRPGRVTVPGPGIGRYTFHT